MGPEVMNACEPEQAGTEEHGKMLKRIQILEDGRLKRQKIGKLKEKRRITRKEHTRLRNEFEMGGFMAQKDRSMESCQRENTAGQRCSA